MSPAPQTIAMFPLGSVLFPYAMLPLHVFEPRYRLMTKRVMQHDHEFGVVLIERGHEVGGGDVRFDVATIASVVRADELPDGRYALTTVGIRRVRVERWLPDDPYPQAEVVVFPDPPARESDGITRDLVVDALARVFALARRIDSRVGEPPALDSDPLRASYEAAAVAPIGPIDAQQLLEAAGAGERLTLLAAMLEDRAQDIRARLDLDE